MQAPPDVEDRLRLYVSRCGLEIGEQIGCGVDGFLWLTIGNEVVKVCRREGPYLQEKRVYERLAQRKLTKLRGFTIPAIVDTDDDLFVLRMRFVTPPFLIDFGAAVLDTKPPDFPLDSAAWRAEKQRVYGPVDWPEVERLIEALMQYGIFYTDVHRGNIRPRR